MIATRTQIQSAISYRISSCPGFITAEPYLQALGIVRDAPGVERSWEEFDLRSVPRYFTDGIGTLHTQLDKLADLSRPRKPHEDKNLWFMLESLIQARRLIDETKKNTKGS